MSANLRQFLVLVFVVAGPVAWILSELFARPLIRRICGVFALCSSILVGVLIGFVHDMSLNTSYSSQTHELLKTAADSLRANKNAQVLQAFETASTNLTETYESSHYLEIAKKAIEEMKK